jgi:acyl-CoA dehydrogenase
LIHQTAMVLLSENASRDRLTQGIYINFNPDDATGKLELAFKAVLAAAPVEAKLRLAQKQKQLPKQELNHIIDLALAKQIISQKERTLFKQAEQARFAAISVDDFSTEELQGRAAVRKQ